MDVAAEMDRHIGNPRCDARCDHRGKDVAVDHVGTDAAENAHDADEREQPADAGRRVDQSLDGRGVDRDVRAAKLRRDVAVERGDDHRDVMPERFLLARDGNHPRRAVGRSCGVNDFHSMNATGTACIAERRAPFLASRVA